MYLKSLEIANMRCFRQTGAHFLYPESDPPVRYPNINVLLGNNGMGKTATLKAVALAILSPIMSGSSGYVPYYIVRREGEEPYPPAKFGGELILHEQDVDVDQWSPGSIATLSSSVERYYTTEEIVSTVSRGDPPWGNMWNDDCPSFFMVGYGANRAVESSRSYDRGLRSKVRRPRYERVSSLFEEQATLTPLTAWLPDMQKDKPERFDLVVDLIQRLLPRDTFFKGRLVEGDYQFNHHGVDIAFGALSDGYRAYIGWICDLLYQIDQGGHDDLPLDENRGIVLIDEIDLHLHPEWQRIVLPTLSETLPKLQFICTTHSPIVIGTVYTANLHVLLPDGESASRLDRPREEVHGLNADQILTSPYFGLVSSRAPSFVEELREVSKKARRGDDEAAKRLARMMAHGSAAAEMESDSGDYPDWIEQAAKSKREQGQ